jgi:hypothetical protein
VSTEDSKVRISSLQTWQSTTESERFNRHLVRQEGALVATLAALVRVIGKPN